MNVNEFLYSLRLHTGDTNKTEFSDYQIINTLNSVLKIINNALVKRRSNLIIKSETLELADGKAALDYQHLIEQKR